MSGSDIFFSYAREDEARIAPVVAAFEARGWSVFWDKRIPAGQTWRSYIGRALEQARCVVVVWSEYSIQSEWVIEEADDGRERGILVPAFIDAVRPPRGFRAIQAVNLSGWSPERPSPAFDSFLADVGAVLGAPHPEPVLMPHRDVEGVPLADGSPAVLPTESLGDEQRSGHHHTSAASPRAHMPMLPSGQLEDARLSSVPHADLTFSLSSSPGTRTKSGSILGSSKENIFLICTSVFGTFMTYIIIVSVSVFFPNVSDFLFVLILLSLCSLWFVSYLVFLELYDLPVPTGSTKLLLCKVFFINFTIIFLSFPVYRLLTDNKDVDYEDKVYWPLSIYELATISIAALFTIPIFLLANKRKGWRLKA